MNEPAEFKGSRAGHAFLGVTLIALSGICFWLPFYATEEEFLNTRVRRGGGFLKLIEQTIGWQLFTVLIVVFAVWLLIMGLVSLWKVLNKTADVAAYPDRIEFHPAVRREPATYDDIDYWKVEFVSGHPVLWIRFNEPYWSLQGMWKRKTVKLEGGKEELEPLFNYFAHHPSMGPKFVRAG